MAFWKKKPKVKPASALPASAAPIQALRNAEAARVAAMQSTAGNGAAASAVRTRPRRGASRSANSSGEGSSSPYASHLAPEGAPATNYVTTLGNPYARSLSDSSSASASEASVDAGNYVTTLANPYARSLSDSSSESASERSGGSGNYATHLYAQGGGGSSSSSESSSGGGNYARALSASAPRRPAAPAPAAPNEYVTQLYTTDGGASGSAYSGSSSSSEGSSSSGSASGGGGGFQQQYIVQGELGGGFRQQYVVQGESAVSDHYGSSYSSSSSEESSSEEEPFDWGTTLGVPAPAVDDGGRSIPLEYGPADGFASLPMNLGVSGFHKDEDIGNAHHNTFVSNVVRSLPVDLKKRQAEGHLKDLPDLKGRSDDDILNDHALMREGLKRLFGWSEADLQLYDVNAKEVRGAKVKYLRTEQDRLPYQAVLGPTITRADGTPMDTSSNVSKFSGPGFAIYVMDGHGRLFVGQHAVGLFHHSSFMGGQNVSCAGEIRIVGGKLQGITNKSGHYMPSTYDFQTCLEALHNNGVSLSGVLAQVLTGRMGHWWAMAEDVARNADNADVVDPRTKQPVTA